MTSLLHIAICNITIIGVFMAISPTYANSTNQIAALKELYTDDF